jgi:hypothetical protein
MQVPLRQLSLHPRIRCLVIAAYTEQGVEWQALLHAAKSALAGDLFQTFGGSLQFLFPHALEERTYDGVVTHSLGTLAVGFFRPKQALFLQELLLNVPLHLHTVKVPYWFHKSITSYGE